MTSKRTKWIVLAFCVLPLLIVGCNVKPDPKGAKRYYSEADSLDYDARIGRVLWNKYCAVCHGVDGKGNGFNAFNLKTHPRDVSDSAFQQTVSDSLIMQIIRKGGTMRGGSVQMPSWEATIHEMDMRRIVKYIRTLNAAGMATKAVQ